MTSNICNAPHQILLGRKVRHKVVTLKEFIVYEGNIDVNGQEPKYLEEVTRAFRDSPNLGDTLKIGL